MIPTTESEKELILIKMCAHFICVPPLMISQNDSTQQNFLLRKKFCTKHAIATLWYIGTLHVICVFQSRGEHLLFMFAKNSFPLLLKSCPKLTPGRLPLPYACRHEIVKHDVPIFFQSGDGQIAQTIPIQCFLFLKNWNSQGMWRMV